MDRPNVRAMKHTTETKAKLSAMRKGAANPFFGRKHSEETRAKMAESTRQRNAARRYVPNAQSVRIPSGADLGYLAGIIDGEGSIGVRANGRVYVTVYNTCLSLMEWLEANVGGKVGASPDRRGRELCYAWSIQALNDVAAVVRAVVPMLHAKADDAARTLAYIATLDSHDGK